MRAFCPPHTERVLGFPPHDIKVSNMAPVAVGWGGTGRWEAVPLTGWDGASAFLDGERQKIINRQETDRK